MTVYIIDLGISFVNIFILNINNYLLYYEYVNHNLEIKKTEGLKSFYGISRLWLLSRKSQGC